MATRSTILVLALLTVGASAVLACSGGGQRNGNGGNSPTPSESVTSAATATVPGGLHDPSAIEGGLASDASSGGGSADLVKALLASIAAGNGSRVMGMIEWQSAPCVAGAREGSFPVCLDDEQGGTPVEYVPFADPTLIWGIRREDIELFFESVLSNNPATPELAGRVDEHWYIVFSLASERPLPDSLGLPKTASYLEFEIDPGSEYPIVGIAAGDAAPLSMYRLYDPALAGVVYIRR